MIFNVTTKTYKSIYMLYINASLYNANCSHYLLSRFLQHYGTAGSLTYRNAQLGKVSQQDGGQQLPQLGLARIHVNMALDKMLSNGQIALKMSKQHGINN